MVPGSCSNFNPRNIQYIPACPVGLADRTGVVKIFAFLDLGQNWAFFKGLYLSLPNLDRLVESRKIPFIVIPAKAGIQFF
jgi:hypothetical protein